jgi:hypothetical protein
MTQAKVMPRAEEREMSQSSRPLVSEQGPGLRRDERAERIIAIVALFRIHTTFVYVG